MPDRVSLPDPPLLLITDRKQASRPLEEIAAAAFDAGIRWVSVREKDLPIPDQTALAVRIAEKAPDDALVGIHGSPYPVLHEIGAWHLPQAGNLSTARQKTRHQALIGKSCHDVEAARAASRDGADYVTLSPVFNTNSKPDYGPALGPRLVQEAAAALSAASCRLIALGGVSLTTIGVCRQAGADGIAVMGEIMRSANPGVAARALIQTWIAAEFLRPSGTGDYGRRSLP